MRQRQMFCSGCHRDVRVLMTDEVVDDAHANVRDPELICLEVGDWCHGAMCPLGSAAPSAMVTRLIHRGMATDHLTTVRGRCDACGLEAELALYGRDLAACTVCGTTCARPARA